MPKRRDNGEGTLRKRDDGTWEGRVSVNGKRKSVYGNTKAEAKLKLMAAAQEMHAPNKPGDMTVGEWAKLCIANNSGHWAPSTIHHRTIIVDLYILPYIGDIELADLCHTDIRRMYAAWMKHGYSDGTMKTCKEILTVILNQAVLDKVIAESPAVHVHLCASTKSTPEIAPLNEDELRLFLSAIQGTPIADILFVDVFTGLRRGELVGLTWDCIDFDNETIRVYRQKNENHKGDPSKPFVPLKTRKERTIYPPHAVFETLRRIKKQQAENRLALGTAWQNPHDFVFTHRNGKPQSSNGLYFSFKVIVKQIGLAHLRLHDLRHTYATLSIQNGVDPKTVSAMLGHSNVNFTLNVYTHFTNNAGKKSAEKMQEFVTNL